MCQCSIGENYGQCETRSPECWNIGNPLLAKKLLHSAGVTDCFLVTKGNTKEDLNLIEALPKVLCQINVTFWTH